MHQYRFFPSVEAFSETDFLNPPASFHPVYIWQWQAPVSQEETERQLLEMKRLGVKAVYVLPLPKGFRPTSMATSMTPDYLTPPYFEAYRYAVEMAASLGMSLWIYDEGGWPSGGACGAVMSEHPEYARRILNMQTLHLEEQSVWHQKQGTVAFREDGTQLSDGYVSDGEDITEYSTRKICFDVPGAPELPDVMNPEAVKAFIRITHEGYKSYLQKEFGKSVKAVFTDEPCAPSPVPYSEELAAEFEGLYGYSIEPFLPALSGGPGKYHMETACSPEQLQARIDWFQMCSVLFCQNFMLQNKTWINANGMSFVGHLNGDDKPLGIANYHLMRALRCLDVPGVDVIWRQIFPAEEPSGPHYFTGTICENKSFPRYASSAAAQIGTTRALTESFGVYGQGMTFDEMRYVLQFQAVRGINVFNLFGVPYGRRGQYMTGELPFFTEQHACYKDLPVFNAYLERLSYVASVGYSNNRTALYVPMYDLWAGVQNCSEQFEALAEILERLHIPFDIMDDDVLRDADRDALAQGQIRMGRACYDTVVMQHCSHMPENSRSTLEMFVQGGGRVVCSVDSAGNEKKLAGVLQSPLTLSGETDALRLADRVAENGRLFMIFNESVRKVSFGVHTEKEYVILHLLDGTVIAPEHCYGGCARDSRLFSLESGEMLCLWISGVGAEENLRQDNPQSDNLLYDNTTYRNYQCDNILYAKPTGLHLTKSSGMCFKEYFLQNDVTLRRSNRFSVGNMEYITEEITEAPIPVALGDWSDIVGRDFSGSCIYTTHFKKPEAEEIFLDMGEVHYTCEAFVNGKSLGICVMKPYLFRVQTEDLTEDNLLEIRVSNTAANAYHYTKSFDKWKDWQLGPYWPIGKGFGENSLSGGLYGPIRILTFHCKNNNQEERQ